MASVNPIGIINIIASVQGIVVPLFIIMTWVFHWSCEVLIRGQQLTYQTGCRNLDRQQWSLFCYILFYWWANPFLMAAQSLGDRQGSARALCPWYEQCVFSSWWAIEYPLRWSSDRCGGQTSGPAIGARARATFGRLSDHPGPSGFPQRAIGASAWPGYIRRDGLCAECACAASYIVAIWAA